MVFSRELAERICREMGMEFYPEQEGVMICGKKIPDDFSTEKLFRTWYYSIKSMNPSELADFLINFKNSQLPQNVESWLMEEIEPNDEMQI